MVSFMLEFPRLRHHVYFDVTGVRYAGYYLTCLYLYFSSRRRGLHCSEMSRQSIKAIKHAKVRFPALQGDRRHQHPINCASGSQHQPCTSLVCRKAKLGGRMTPAGVWMLVVRRLPGYVSLLSLTLSCTA